MAQSFNFGFGNADNFSDWAKYAGFDRKTGEPASFSFGVEPPQDMEELLQKGIVDPFNKQVDAVKQVGTNMSNAMSQFGQGNMIQGMNAARGKYPAQQQQEVATPWKLAHDLDED